MKVLITGAAGFIGSFLSRRLLSEGYDVVGVDNFHEYYARGAKEFNLDLTRAFVGRAASQDQPKAHEILGLLQKFSLFSQAKKKLGKFDFFECDIRDKDGLARIFRENEVETIVHLAAMAGVQASIHNPKLYADVNILGTINLLDLAVEYKIQNFVFASSSSVYGATTEVPFKETQNVDNPISPYAATKRMNEIMNYTYSYLHSLPVTCLRFFTVYGPLQRPYGMVIQKFIKHAYHDKKLPVYGDGTMKRDYTYIDDIVDGIVRALQKPQKYEIYNLGNENPVDLNELTSMIIKLLGKGEVEYLESPKTEVPITYADISKAKNDLGYNPSVKILEGLKRQVEVYKAMPEWYKELMG